LKQNDPYGDVTLSLFDDDWRTATNHPLANELHRGSQFPSAKQPHSKPTFITPDAQYTASNAPKPVSPDLRKSALGPGLVPSFFAKLGGQLKADFFSSHQTQQWPSDYDTSQTSGPRPRKNVGQVPFPAPSAPSPKFHLAPSILSMGAPREPVKGNTIPTSLPTNMPHSVPVDPAANMLNMLQNKLANIQSSIRKIPRTGYMPRNQFSHIAPPSQPSQPVSSERDALDDDFVALVEVQCTPTPLQPQDNSSCLGKRKLEEQNTCFEIASREESKQNLKERNRASAKASRERKKRQVETLRKQIDLLTSQNLELAQTCQDVAEDNEKLRKELEELGYKGEKLDRIGQIQAPESKQQESEQSASIVEIKAERTTPEAPVDKAVLDPMISSNV
jgi:hypothetical protein